jgi:hypothetical protein
LSAGAVVGAALGFYLVSLRVASERAALEDVESRIALTQRDIRLLQTEIGTRGRLAQLERWNVRFIRLSAPNADQFVDGGFQLAALVAPQKTPAIGAPVVLAAAPAPPTDLQPRLAAGSNDAPVIPGPSRTASEMLHVASYTVPQAKTPATVQPFFAKPAAKHDASTSGTSAKNGPAAKPVKTATADPLAPLPRTGTTPKGSGPTAAAGGTSSKTQKARATD